MGNRKELVSSLQELREDNIRKQKRGLHFIVASVFIWVAVLGIHISSLPILSKNLFTFCCSTPLVPLAFLLSKILKIDFQNKENPLSGLGLLISLNHMILCYAALFILESAFSEHLVQQGQNDYCMFESKLFGYSSTKKCAVILP